MPLMRRAPDIDRLSAERRARRGAACGRRMLGSSVGVVMVVIAMSGPGCAAGGAVGQRATDTWQPPRSGLVTHELAAASSALAGRGDERLGHVQRENDAFEITRIDHRSRLSTTGRGRVIDSVTRRIRSTTIFRGF